MDAGGSRECSAVSTGNTGKSDSVDGRRKQERSSLSRSVSAAERREGTWWMVGRRGRTKVLKRLSGRSRRSWEGKAFSPTGPSASRVASSQYSSQAKSCCGGQAPGARRTTTPTLHHRLGLKRLKAEGRRIVCNSFRAPQHFFLLDGVEWHHESESKVRNWSEFRCSSDQFCTIMIP